MTARILAVLAEWLLPARMSFPPAVGERVFVNCPFDDDRREMFDAIVFSLIYCGLTPIIAPIRKGSGQSRLDFILRQARKECRFSVHDITPVGNAETRYNMAFELGIFLCAGHGERCLILAADRRLFADRFSDLAGLDIENHGGKSADAARKVAQWLTKYPLELPKPAEVENEFSKFHEPFGKECEKYGWQTGDDLSLRAGLIKTWISDHLPRA